MYNGLTLIGIPVPYRPFMSRKLFSFLLVLVLFTALTVLPVQTTRAQAGTASQMIQAVNQLRANNGMFALEPHPILMSIAQSHSEYQASIGTWSHVGPGGTRVKDRARAAGFCDGGGFFASENVAVGYNLSIQETIYTHWNDPAHMNTMLSGWGSEYIYIGAGVAKKGDLVAYTVVTGVCSGQPAPTNPPGHTTAVPTTTAIPVAQNTPNPDGSIIHVVQPGQTLWTISVVYDVPLETIKDLNGFTDNTYLYPGDEVLIKAGEGTLTPTPAPPSATPPAPSASPTPTARKTQEATGLPSISLKTPQASPTPTPVALPFAESNIQNPVLIVISIVVSAGTIILVFLRSFTRQ